MGLIVGILMVIGCTLGGYMAMGGKLGVLWQPFEVVIIVGSAIGAYIISNPASVLKSTGGAIGKTLKGAQFKKEHYLELLQLLYQLLKVAKTKGNLGLEQHIENPQDSALFQQFPGVMANDTAITFICDYLRMLTLGSDNPHEMEALMDEEIELVHHEHSETAHALQTMADGMPALGIVAAVLGVIKTMGSITEPPEILGKLIGGALVGTFLGVWVSYGFVGPIASKAQSVYDAEIKFLHCIKAALLAHMHGSAPAVSVEFARKALVGHERPTFYEVEEAVGALPPVS
ncbi:flagellar motor stator protein MotA [Pelagibius sp.]|uniref:flagellar motor stator protein MotA n=1 Tax=Pelagibius sp. TaxID=1931238 RepID=UPI002622D51D|nr:flagellar motor stator protein MotA [Pelagibius sp.]